MSRSLTAMGLAAAWAHRMQEAAKALGHMHVAPALFKPEYVAKVQAEYTTALGWAGYWRAQAES